MKKNVCITAILFAAGSLLAADPKDTVLAAAKALTDGGNYSWKQTVENAAPAGGGGGGFGGGAGGPQVTEGKVVAGLIWTSAPGRGRGGFGGGGGGGFGGGGADAGGGAPPPPPANVERIFKGTNSATKGPDGTWQTAEELAAAAAANGGGGGGGGFGGRRGGRGGFGAGAPTLPADNIATLVGYTKNLTESGGVISGDLSEDGAKAQLQFGGRGGRGGFGGGGGGGGGGATPPDITGAKSSIKIWVVNGALTKYELKAAGAMSFNGNDINIDRTTTVEFKDAGSAKIDAPADVIAKISK